MLSWQRFKNPFFDYLRGLGIGVAVILPGMSGGAAALILGVYEDFVLALKRLRVPRGWPMLLGIAIGVVAGAKLIGWLLLDYPTVLFAFLLGLVLMTGFNMSLPVFKSFRLTVYLWWLVGFVLAFLVAIQSSEIIPSGQSLSRYLIGGIVAAAALLLPGLSGGTLMVLLGLYDDLILALNTWQWSVLLTYGLGAGLGLMGMAHVVSLLLKRYRAKIMALLAGLMLGSGRALWPESLGVAEAISFVVGVLVIHYSGRQRE